MSLLHNSWFCIREPCILLITKANPYNKYEILKEVGYEVRL